MKVGGEPGTRAESRSRPSSFSSASDCRSSDDLINLNRQRASEHARKRAFQLCPGGRKGRSGACERAMSIPLHVVIKVAVVLHRVRHLWLFGFAVLQAVVHMG